MSDMEDESIALFGELESASIAEDVTMVREDFTVEGYNLLKSAKPLVDSNSRIIKFPVSALSVETARASTTKSHAKSANTIRVRPAPDGTGVESNARLVQWEDDSWSVIVGKEHFRILERKEHVELFHKLPGGVDMYLYAGSVGDQFSVIPGSLDSRTHKHVVEQSTVARKLIETRKVTLAHGVTPSTTSGSSMLPVANEAKRARKTGPALTADFLEAGLGNGASVKDIKTQYKRAAGLRRKRGADVEEDEEKEESLDEYEEDELSSDSSDDSSSDSDESSSSSSSSESSE